MSSMLWLRDLSIAECALCYSVAALLLYRGVWRKFGLLFSLIVLRALSGSVLIPLLFFRKSLGLDLPTAYNIYFFTDWFAIISQMVLVIAIIYNVYRDAMRPLQGLQRIGKVIFRWVAVVSMAVSVAIAFGPHLTTADYTKTAITSMMVSQIQQGTSVLTLCLLLFVCFAIRPLGLTFRSRIFGVTLGLGLTATTSLVQAAWLATVGAQSLYSPIYLVSAIGSLFAICTWGTYFVLPEPERKMILLPTTSPFFTWNRISEALGDEPGYVAVAGFRPDMLAAAELKVLSSTSSRAIRATNLPSTHVEPAAARVFHSIAVSQ